MSEAEHIDISGQRTSGMDNMSTNQTLEGVQLQPAQNTGNTSEKEHQSEPKALQTKPLQESSRILDFDTTVSFQEHLSDSGSIVCKTVEYQNATVVDGQCEPAELTNFVAQSGNDEKECFSINELLLTDYPPGFEVHPSVADEKGGSGIKETITDYPPGFEINTLHDVTNKPGHPNTVVSDLAVVEQLGNSSGMEYNILGQSSVGVGQGKHSALVEEDRPATGFDDASKDVVDHYEWSSIIKTFSEYPPGFGVEIMHDVDHKSNPTKDLVEDGVSVLKSEVEQTGPSVEHKGGQHHEQLGSASESVAEDLHKLPTDTGHNNGVLNPLPAIVERDSEPVTEDLPNCPTVTGHDDGVVVNPFPTSAKQDSEPVVEDFNIRPTTTGHDDGVVDPFPMSVKQDSEPVAEDLHICPTAAGHEDGVANPVPMSGKKDSDHSCRRQRRTPHTKVKSRYSLRSSVNSIKLPRSSSQQKPKDQNQNDAAGNVSDRGRKRRGRKKRMEKKSHDEFSKTRVHLRYLLNRMKYDLTLLEAYSSEGWRGQSLEKLRPEKELERAKADINRRKSKIRSLFQHLDSICAEGRFPDSLYDSDGLIDSEDIYCAKCGSKELSADNDIILCDGACDRGFHQFCLDPPLRTEEIPPGDQGWLCPACDCKVDCIDLLNDYHVTKLSVGDGWEKVFPEAATAASGNGQDNSFTLPSDDSDDNDYDPDKADNDDADDDKVEGSGSSSESSSNESDFSSASEDLGAICGVQQDLGLPSDDSEDDDFDPNAPDMDEQDKQDVSSSDFTSASEDLGAAHDTEVSGKDEEPQSVLEPDHCGDDAGHISARRHVERLNYKKLYDETYGNASSESSDDDDEEWKDTSDTTEADSIVKIKITPGRQRICQNPAPEGMEGSQAWLNKRSPKSTTSSKSRERGLPKRLGDEKKQRLHALFKENQYPDRTTKENLAKELGLTPYQVSKWFGNARWSFNHPSHGGPSTPQSASRGRGGNNPSKVEASSPGSVSKGHARKNPSQGEASTPESVSKVRARKIPSQGEVSTPGSSSKGRARKNPSQGKASIPERVSKGRARKNPSQTEENAPGNASKGHARKKPSQGETSTPGSASKQRGAKRKSEHEDYPNVACNGSKKPSTRARAAVKQCGGTDLRINNFDSGESSTKQSRKRKTNVEDRDVIIALSLRPDKLQTQGIPEVGSSHAVEVQRGRPGRRKSGA